MKRILLILSRFVVISLIILFLLIVCSYFIAYPDRYRAEFFSPMSLSEIWDNFNLFAITSMVIGLFVTFLYTNIKD